MPTTTEMFEACRMNRRLDHLKPRKEQVSAHLPNCFMWSGAVVMAGGSRQLGYCGAQCTFTETYSFDFTSCALTRFLGNTFSFTIQSALKRLVTHTDRRLVQVLVNSTCIGMLDHVKWLDGKRWKSKRKKKRKRPNSKKN